MSLAQKMSSNRGLASRGDPRGKDHKPADEVFYEVMPSEVTWGSNKGRRSIETIRGVFALS